MSTEAKKAQQIASSVLRAFDDLTQTYQKLFRLCYAVLAAGKTQEERNRVRAAIKVYLDAKESPEDHTE